MREKKGKWERREGDGWKTEEDRDENCGENQGEKEKIEDEKVGEGGGGNGRDRGDRFIEKRMYVGGGRTKMVQRK